MQWTKNMKPVPFVGKSHILLEDYDGYLTPMDVPYFKATLIAPGTWQVLSDGDYTYVIEGEDEALVIDSGYGCGDLRAFCQSLTEKPVYRIANTHSHFDHTANNYLFDCAYMSQDCYDNRTIAKPSHYGIDFPRDYPCVIIDEGYVFHLGSRDIEVYSFKGHSPQSPAFLDRKERILFSGDEMVVENYNCKYSVEFALEQLKKFDRLSEHYDTFCTGPGIFEARPLIDGYIKCAEYILAGGEGIPAKPNAPTPAFPSDEYVTRYMRRIAHPCDLFLKPDPDIQYKRDLWMDGRLMNYDVRKIFEEK